MDINTERVYKTPIYTRNATKNYHDKLKADNIEQFNAKALESVKKSQIKFKEQIIEYRKEYYVLNKERILAQQRQLRLHKKMLLNNNI